MWIQEKRYVTVLNQPSVEVVISRAIGFNVVKKRRAFFYYRQDPNAFRPLPALLLVTFAIHCLFKG